MGAAHEYMYKTTIKLRPGWTEKAIQIFLGEPDKKKPGVKNHKGGGGTRKLYLRERVQRIEKTAEFQEFVKRNQVRRDAAKKASQSYQSSQRSQIQHIR